MAGSSEPPGINGWGNETICVGKDLFAAHTSIWFGEEFMGHPLSVFMAQIILSNVISKVLYALLRPLKQSNFVCSLLGGILLGPSYLSRNKKFAAKMFPTVETTSLLEVSSFLGVLLFSFIMIIKMDPLLTTSTPKRIWSMGVLSVIAPFLFIISFFMMPHNYLLEIHGPGPSMLASFGLTHYPSVAHMLEELGLMNSEIGQLSLCLTMINDFLGFLIGVALRLFELSLASRSQALWAFSSICMLILFTTFVMRPFIMWIIKRTPRGQPVRELYVIVLLLGALFLSFVADAIGGIMMGALFLGMAIPSGPPLGSTIVERSETIIIELLVPTLFVNVGYHTNIHSLRRRDSLIRFMQMITGICVVRMIAILVPCLFYDIRMRHGCVLGLMLHMKGVVDLIIYHQWKASNILDEESYSMLVLSSLVSAAIVVPLIDTFYDPRGASRTTVAQQRSRALTLQTTPPDAELRILSCVHSEEDVPSIITLLKGSRPTMAAPIRICVVHMMELTGRAAPLMVPYRKGKRILQSKITDHIMRAFSNYSENFDGSLPTTTFMLIAPYKSMHESLCKLAQEMSTRLIIIPFQNGQLTAGLHVLNTSVQAHAKCTVGILVDKGHTNRSLFDETPSKVAVVFLGGPDDREALSYAKRISSCASVHIEILHICLGDEDPKKKRKKTRFDQWYFDQTLMDEFRLKNIDNPRVVYSQFAVEDEIGVFNVIKSAAHGYDLAIVGRRQSLFDSDLLRSWSNNPELGIIGDMLSAADFDADISSVLVVQHSDYFDL